MAIPLTSPRFTTAPTQTRFQQALQNSPTIKKYERNRTAVRLIQQALMDLKFPMPKSTDPKGLPDGDFGKETDESVRAFQAREFPSETPDGKVGRNTLSRLDDLLPYPGTPLPPSGGGGGGGGGGVDDDVDTDEVVTKAVKRVLTGSFTSSIRFKYKGQEINFGWFWLVKQLIDDDKISVIYDPVVADYGLAVYNPDNNSLSGNSIVVPRTNFPTWKHRSVLVHECVHAIQDYKGGNMNRLVSEGAAYVAQNIYHRLATGSKVKDSSGKAQAIHTAADVLAQKAIANWYPTFSQSETDTLENAIRNAGYLASNAVFDGV